MSTYSSAARLQDAIEAERKRIAQDLHDGIGQSLALSKVRIENAVVLLRVGRVAEVSELLAEVALQLRDCIDDVRKIATELRPAMLDDLGLMVTVRWLVRKLQAVHGTVRFQIDASCEEGDIPQAIKLPAFRIIQEAINNAVKHAHARNICVSVKRLHASLYVHIDDDGRGFATDELTHTEAAMPGIGLDSMRDRAKSSGGNISIYSRIGAGTQIDVQWPIPSAEFESNLGLLEGHLTQETEYPPLDIRL